MENSLKVRIVVQIFGALSTNLPESKHHMRSFKCMGSLIVSCLLDVPTATIMMTSTTVFAIMTIILFAAVNGGCLKALGGRHEVIAVRYSIWLL